MNFTKTYLRFHNTYKVKKKCQIVIISKNSFLLSFVFHTIQYYVEERESRDLINYNIRQLTYV